MRIINDPAELQTFALSEKAGGQSIGLVPTMGNFHEGHLSLMKQARKDNDKVITTLFVNPTQFGPTEDLDNYPRTFQNDCDQAEKVGVDILFAPEPKQIYPSGYQTYVELGAIASRLCGASRASHFRGVATVVLKLLNLAQPTKAYFGLKDYQQLQVIKTMVRDFDLPVEIVSMQIIREKDGLALSSRNAYLTADERHQAPILYQSLHKAEKLWKGGMRDVAKLMTSVIQSINSQDLTKIDYVEACDPETLEPSPDSPASMLIATAVYFPSARLIDNILLK